MIKQTIIKSFLSAVVFFCTLGLLSYAYWAYQSWTSDINSWETLTATIWNQMQDNQINFDERITSLEWNTFTWYNDFYQDENWNIGIWESNPSAKLEINWSIATNALWYQMKESVMPNDMSYPADWYADGSEVTLDMWAYLLKYYMCDYQNTFGSARVGIISTSWTIDTYYSNYIHNDVNFWTCWYYLTDLLKVISDTAVVKMRFLSHNGNSNIDNNPDANAVRVEFIKIY